MREDDDVPESMVQGEQNPELPTAEGEQKDMVCEDQVAINRKEANAESQARRPWSKRRTPSNLKDYLTV